MTKAPDISPHSLQRLFLSLAVLVTLATIASPFLFLGLQSSLRDNILAECQGGDFNLFQVCWEKAQAESFYPIWIYLLSFLPLVITIWIKWIWQLPFPQNPSLLHSKFFHAVEILLILLS
jgi:hypothetical protein